MNEVREAHPCKEVRTLFHFSRRSPNASEVRGRGGARSLFANSEYFTFFGCGGTLKSRVNFTFSGAKLASHRGARASLNTSHLELISLSTTTLRHPGGARHFDGITVGILLQAEPERSEDLPIVYYTVNMAFSVNKSSGLRRSPLQIQPCFCNKYYPRFVTKDTAEPDTLSRCIVLIQCIKSAAEPVSVVNTTLFLQQAEPDRVNPALSGTI